MEAERILKQRTRVISESALTAPISSGSGVRPLSLLPQISALQLDPLPLPLLRRPTSPPDHSPLILTSIFIPSLILQYYPLHCSTYNFLTSLPSPSPRTFSAMTEKESKKVERVRYSTLPSNPKSKKRMPLKTLHSTGSVAFRLVHAGLSLSACDWRLMCKQWKTTTGFAYEDDPYVTEVDVVGAHWDLVEWVSDSAKE